MFNSYFESEGFNVIGYRDVPVDTNAIAKHVADTMPYIQQVFLDIRGVENVEKQLYLARKQIERYGEEQSLELYFTSLSKEQLYIKVGYVQIKLKGCT